MLKMDYRPAFLIGIVVVLLVNIWLLRVSARAQLRGERKGGMKGTAWVQLDIRFAVFALIFIAFDMEMLYMFPWAVAYQVVGMTAFWDALVFAGILGVGLLYAGKRGGFRL